MDVTDQMNSSTPTQPDQPKWIESEGGPYIVVPASLVPAWQGVEGDDYDAACEIDDYLGLVTFGTGNKAVGLVVADEPLPATFLPDLASVLQWSYAPSDAALVNAAQASVDSIAQWHPGPQLDITEPLVMFDATIPGASVTDEEQLRLSPPHGRVQFHTADFESGADIAGRLHTIRPCP